MRARTLTITIHSCTRQSPKLGGTSAFLKWQETCTSQLAGLGFNGQQTADKKIFKRTLLCIFLNMYPLPWREFSVDFEDNAVDPGGMVEKLPSRHTTGASNPLSLPWYQRVLLLSMKEMDASDGLVQELSFQKALICLSGIGSSTYMY